MHRTIKGNMAGAEIRPRPFLILPASIHAGTENDFTERNGNPSSYRLRMQSEVSAETTRRIVP